MLNKTNTTEYKSNEDIDVTNYDTIINTLLWITVVVVCIVIAVAVFVITSSLCIDGKYTKDKNYKINKTEDYQYKRSDETIQISNISDINKSAILK